MSAGKEAYKSAKVGVIVLFQKEIAKREVFRIQEAIQVEAYQVDQVEQHRRREDIIQITRVNIIVNLKKIIAKRNLDVKKIIFM